MSRVKNPCSRSPHGVWAHSADLSPINPPGIVMRTVDVIVTLLAATDKLVLVSLHGDRDNAVWLHRDAISIAGLIESDHNCIITLPAQLARKKKLISYVSRPRHPNSVYQATGRARRRMHHDPATTLERWSVRRSFWQYLKPMWQRIPSSLVVRNVRQRG
jgi:hypothetical protein